MTDMEKAPPKKLDRRRAALKEIDEAEFGWKHIKACLVSGTGFFMDAYDLFAINFASTMIGHVYYHGKTPADVDMGLKVSGSVGTLFGQLFFGYLADLLGRKKMYGVELMIIIVATVGSALSGDGYAATVSGTIMFWRVIMGVGIGGDYPLSAVITSEFATRKNRGAMMAAVFAMQGFGILGSSIVSLLVLSGYQFAIYQNILAVDYCWRLVLGLGAVPGLLALYFRLTIPESPRYTMDVEQDIDQATSDVTAYLKSSDKKSKSHEEEEEHEAPTVSWSDFMNHFGKWENGKVLLGTAMSWFALDVAFYGVNLNNNIILGAIGYAEANDADPNIRTYNSLKNAAIGNIIMAMLGTVPGYWLTVAFVDKWGRKPIQMMGFVVLTLIFALIGISFDILKQRVSVFVILFTVIQLFLNFGPNATTFIVPGEVFPTRYRSTGHGISAASGKLGAIVAQVGFSKLKDIGGPNKFVPNLLLIFAGWMFIGGVFSTLIPETNGVSLEELANENDYDDDGSSVDDQD